MKTINEICDEIYAIVGYNDAIKPLLTAWSDSIIDTCADSADMTIESLNSNQEGTTMEIDKMSIYNIKQLLS